MTRQITLIVKGNEIPEGFSNTVNPYGTKFTATFNINKHKEPLMTIINVEINVEEPGNGFNELSELDDFFYSIQDLRKG